MMPGGPFPLSAPRPRQAAPLCTPGSGRWPAAARVLASRSPGGLGTLSGRAGRGPLSAPAPEARTPGLAPRQAPQPLTPAPPPQARAAVTCGSPARSLGLSRGREEGAAAADGAARGGGGSLRRLQLRAPGAGGLGRAGGPQPPRRSLRPARSPRSLAPRSGAPQGGLPGGGRGRLAGPKAARLGVFSPFSQHTGNNRASGDAGR